jgi:hypothetical protein
MPNWDIPCTLHKSFENAVQDSKPMERITESHRELLAAG